MTVPVRVVFLGPPGAGKGTQAKQLAEHFEVPHVASGDLFRKHQVENTELGQLAKRYMERGELVPDGVTISMVLERLQEPDAANGYILDGFPRTLEQARALDKALAEHQRSIDRTPLLQVDTEELVRRLAGRWLCSKCQRPYHEVTAPPKEKGICDVCGGELMQRADDQPDVVRKRLQTYEEQTAPLVGYYKEQGKLRTVNGDQAIEDVGRDLISAMME
ncbi:MAG: adenylate kinase [Chloroflexi bacterium]|nr:adenylate kinase [Chloroflexota bacterium]